MAVGVRRRNASGWECGTPAAVSSEAEHETGCFDVVCRASLLHEMPVRDADRVRAMWCKYFLVNCQPDGGFLNKSWSSQAPTGVGRLMSCGRCYPFVCCPACLSALAAIDPLPCLLKLLVHVGVVAGSRKVVSIVVDEVVYIGLSRVPEAFLLRCCANVEGTVDNQSVLGGDSGRPQSRMGERSTRDARSDCDADSTKGASGVAAPDRSPSMTNRSRERWNVFLLRRTLEIHLMRDRSQSSISPWLKECSNVACHPVSGLELEACCLQLETRDRIAGAGGNIICWKGEN